MPKNKFFKGFTLVELLIVIAILGILATVGLVAFTSTQIRGRDVKRKSNLKQIASALELFYSDYSKYPSSSNGLIQGCPYNVSSSGNCSWGGNTSFSDAKTTYFKVLPKDPVASDTYYYRIVDSGTNQKFQLFAHLENTQDQDCIGGNCTASYVSSSCGGICNFAVTSSNTTPTE